MGMAKEKLCGDCIHADICKKVNGSWFHPKNIAYCNAFKERKNCVEVVRCKDCVYNETGSCSFSEYVDPVSYKPDWFCADGERRTDV